MGQKTPLNRVRAIFSGVLASLARWSTHEKAEFRVFWAKIPEKHEKGRLFPKKVDFFGCFSSFSGEKKIGGEKKFEKEKKIQIFRIFSEKVEKIREKSRKKKYFAMQLPR